MIAFPVLIPGQNFLCPGTGNYKMPREGKGNLRLVFPGITGNGNSHSPLLQGQFPGRMLGCCFFLVAISLFSNIGQAHALAINCIKALYPNEVCLVSIVGPMGLLANYKQHKHDPYCHSNKNDLLYLLF